MQYELLMQFDVLIVMKEWQLYTARFFPSLL